jgi:DNA-directed RNA polymerase subunit RPC12/RpoP
MTTTTECRECAAGRQQAVSCDIAWRCPEHGMQRLDVAAILKALGKAREAARWAQAQWECPSCGARYPAERTDAPGVKCSHCVTIEVLVKQRDEAREDAAQLRALIKHYTTAPELSERLRGWDVLCQIGQQEGTR